MTRGDAALARVVKMLQSRKQQLDENQYLREVSLTVKYDRLGRICAWEFGSLDHEEAKP